MKLLVVGTGYVGLVTGACLAKFGNDVICIDTNAEKIRGLSEGKVPFYEPGLSEIIRNNLEAGRLSFSTDLSSALDEGEMVFITVGTPSLEDGGADLADVKTVAETIGRRMKGYKLVVVKSTGPVGACDFVRQTIEAELAERGEAIPFDAERPEREGDGIDVGIRYGEKAHRRIAAP